jgi:hypothetical protein
MIHPITPPPELVQQWCDPRVTGSVHFSAEDLATCAAQWGADAELEACCAFAESQPWGLVNGPHVADVIRAARRPKPPSLKEQALQALAELAAECYGNTDQSDTIRRALEKLDD